MKTQEVQIEAIWNEEKSAALKDFIAAHSQAQPKEQKLRNMVLPKAWTIFRVI